MTIQEQEGRVLKAARWTELLRGFGFTSSEVQRNFTPETWKGIAEAQGLRPDGLPKYRPPGSDATVQAIIGAMEEEERGSEG